MAMERRRFMKGLGAAALLACPICAATSRASAAGKGTAHGGAAPHWSYGGHDGPQNWGELSPRFKVCELGIQQSPIDIKGAIGAKLNDVSVDYRPVPLEILNNGHTIQVNTANGGTARIAGQSYELLQYHFHSPSEHTVDGRAFPMECHFVHIDKKTGKLAVLGVFIEPGAPNETLSALWANMPKTSGAKNAVAGVSVLPSGLLPAGRDLYRYHGSLTTPPCSEIVLWTVFRQPVQASRRQIAAFTSLYPNNARPVQQLFRRFLLGPN